MNTNTTAMLLKMVAQGKLKVDPFISHRFKLDQMLEAHDTFGRAGQTGALKVILER